MQPGDLVRITRASIAVPKNTIGLLLEHHIRSADDDRDIDIWIVRLLNGRQRRYLTRDLEKISAAG